VRFLSGRKVVGSAQKRWGNGLLQQGSIPYSYDGERIKKIFGREKFSALEDKSVGLKDLRPQLDEGGFREIIAASFEETFGISFVQSSPSREELTLAEELEREKYLRAGWNFRE
jgi:lipoate-protein ligase A